MYMFISFAKNICMKKSTKVLLVFYLISIVPSIIFGRYVFVAFNVKENVFSYDFNLFSILGLVFAALSMVIGTILFIKFINSRAVDKAIFFTTLPSFALYGVIMFCIAQLAYYQNDMSAAVRNVLNISAENNYNTILWAVLVSILFIMILFLNFLLLCRPINRVEKIVSRLGDGRIKEEKIRVGGVKQFENIEHGLNKINNNYKSKDNSLQSMKLEAEKYIPKQFFRFLGKNNIAQLESGQQVSKRATVALVKLCRSKSSMMTLEENFQYINSYVNLLSPLVRKFGGFIDRYLGEGVLVVFPHCQEALDCLHAMSRAVEIKNRQNKSLPNITLRASLDEGEVVFGVLGEEGRKIPTILSGASDFLDKFDQIASLIGAKIVFSKMVLDKLPLQYKFVYRFVGSLSQDKQKCLLFEDLEVHPKDQVKLLSKTKGIFERGVLLHEQGQYEKSAFYMEEVLKINSDDRCAYIYFNKSREKVGKLA